MKKDFSNFSFENSFSDRHSLVSVQNHFYFTRKWENIAQLTTLYSTVKGSEKNDPNLRKGILDKSVTPFIL